MAFEQLKDGTIVIEGWEKGIAPSPHLGIANLQAVNIATEPGEVMASYARTQQSLTSITTTGSLAFVDSSHVTLSVPTSNNFFKGTWITVSASTHTGELANGVYYVLDTSSGSNFQLSSTYNGSVISGYTAGLTASISSVRIMSTPLASATEIYTNGGTTFYRYYVLDDQGLVWIYDTANDVFPSDNEQFWILPDTTLLTGATGIAILNGWVLVFAGTTIWSKSTVQLSSTPGWTALAAGQMISSNKHFAMVGHQSTLYYTDANFVGSIFPTTSYASTVPNIFSYASYTTSTTTGTMTQIAGIIPYNGTDNTVRMPVAVFAASGGAVASALAAGTVYYVKWLNSGNTFELYAASAGGSALDITSGASGIQYFNTFYPTSSSGKSTYVFSPQALTLPFFETAQSMAEIGNLVVVGTQGNTIYQWGQVNAQPDGFIPLPENNAVNIINVNNMAYVFSGSKGNIYITNGSTASLALTVPDYAAGYIEPYFVWGGAAYVRGRVYFSLQDQTASHTGQCGGIWSFVPTQNFFIGQDTGLSLRMENQNSYATYNGRASVIINAQNQVAVSPQFWAAWVSSTSSATYGIDFTATTPSTTAIVETDIIPVGTFVNPANYAGIEFRLAAPLVSGDSIQLLYRNNLSFAAFTAVGTYNTVGGLSSRFAVPFANVQWVQFQAKLLPANSTGSSFVRLKQLRIYKET